MVVLIVVLREPFGTLAAIAARCICRRPGVVGIVLPAPLPSSRVRRTCHGPGFALRASTSRARCSVVGDVERPR